MALIGNYSVLNKNPGRAFGGSTVSDTRAQWGKSGAARGRYVQTGGFDPLSSVPDGYRPPYCWQIAVTAGGLSSYTLITGSAGVGTVNLAGGKNAEAAIAGSSSVSDATLQLIVSAVAAITGSGELTANGNAILQAVATIAGTGDVAATVTALGNAIAALAGSGTLTLTSYATGELAADVLPFSELSPEALSAAVWSSAEGAFLYAVAHNKVITDPAAGTFTVYDTDDTTVLYQADLWANAAGTTPYAGAGAERRDRLV